MRLLRLGEPGAEVPAVRDDEGVVHRLDGLTTDIDGAFLAGDGIARTRTALAAGDLPVLDGADALRVGAPIARPGAVVCIGQNYAAHAAESGAAPPEVPIIFFKHPNTVVGPYDDVHLPPGAEKVDWEVELAVVIGRRARYLASPEDALARIAGYTVSNDVSERDYQIAQSGGQWSKGKCCETFNPARPVARPRGRDRRSAAAAAVLRGQRGIPAGLQHRRHDLLRRPHRLAPVPVPGPGPR